MPRIQKHSREFALRVLGYCLMTNHVHLSCALDEAHLSAAMRYVERNPVRARLVRVPLRHRWSSRPAQQEDGTRCGRRE
jgi:hypothetical protein